MQLAQERMSIDRAPYSPGDQSLGPKRSSSRVEKRIDAGRCPVCSTLTAKWLAAVSARTGTLP